MQRFKSLTIEIEGGDAALTDDAPGELARLLRKAASKIEGFDFCDVSEERLYDSNGVHVGTMTVDVEDVPPAGWLCEECLPFVTNGDLTQVDMSEEPEASRLAALIEQGAAALGEVNVDSDMTTESEETCACCGRRSWGTYTGYYDKE